MSKNIVICCDGTGNEYCDANSNVVHIFQTLLQDDAQQVSYYHPGIGTEGSPTSSNRVTAFFSVVAGLAFGAGILNYVGDAYRFLMDKYEDGDRVFLFGFSRGAYTVRALSGMIHMYGLLHSGNVGLIPYILKMYARKSRQAQGMKPEFAVAEGFKATFSRSITLHMVGVWDTVSSVGMLWDPLKLPYTARNEIIDNGRHAVSIDERRCMFRNNLWGLPFPGQSIKQVWFAGVHSDVGGGYAPAEAGLSQITLQWMLGEAVNLGLLVDGERVRLVLGETDVRPPIPPNPAQFIHKSLIGAWWLLELLPHQTYDPITKRKSWKIPMGASRLIPPGSVLHESVATKLAIDPTYKPKNLPVGWEECLEVDDAFAQREMPVERPDPQRLAYSLESDERKIRLLNIGTLGIAALAAFIFSLPSILSFIFNHLHIGHALPDLSWDSLGWVVLLPATLLIAFSIAAIWLKASLKRRLGQTIKFVKSTGGEHADK